MARNDTTERRRLVISAVAGAVVGSVAAVVAPWEMALLVAWDMTAAVLVSRIAVEVAGMDAATTAAAATREDQSRGSTRVLLLIASSASLVGVVFALVRAGDVSGVVRVGYTAAALATVLCSWVLVHTLHALRYAHLYYREVPGGIDFHGDTPPAYPDFAYLAFTIGMTFQVSDTEIEAPDIRRAVLRHALLAYLFGTVIVASAISVIAGLLH